MPCGDGMKVDSQEGLLARGLGKEIRCWRVPERLPAVTARSNTTNLHQDAYFYTQTCSEEFTACPAQSTLIILVILGFYNRCVFIHT